jgi:predicted dehydrogenase
MPSESLPVAIIGVGGFGSFTLRALQRSPAIRLVGLADRSSAAAAEAGKGAGVPFYTDNRSLLAETRPRIVYLCVPPMGADDIVALCADRGIHVWKEMPLARNLDEGVAMVRRMEQARLKLAVGTQRRFETTYRRAWQLRGRLGQVFLGRAHYLFNWGPELGWRGDKASAGGGALLELGYHAVDLLVWMLGLPEEVYGSLTGGKKPAAAPGPGGKLLPPYDTDDTAAALLRYARPLVASVVTTRCSGPVSEELSLHGQAGSLTANSELCLLRDPDGNVLDRTVEESPPLEAFCRQADAFARAVRDDERTYECSGWENLLTLAAIEAIYLSDRTSQPEPPRRLLKTHGLTAEQCLICRPAEEVPGQAVAEVK